MAKFLTIDIGATGVHVSGGVQVVGLPSLTAIDGFVHAIEREFDLPVAGWSMGFRHCEEITGHGRMVNYEFRHKDKKEGSPYIRDKRTATVRGFLVLYTDDLSSSQEALDALNERVEALRFCGGTLILGSHGVQRWNSLADALQMISFSCRDPHFFMEDKSGLLMQRPKELSPMDWLLDLAAKPSYQDGEAAYAHGLGWQGFLTPVIRGYSLLETPRHRDFLRGDNLHAYAEPVIGLVRMRSLASVMFHLDDSSDDNPEIFWFGSFQGEAVDEWSLSTFFVC